MKVDLHELANLADEVIELTDAIKEASSKKEEIRQVLDDLAITCKEDQERLGAYLTGVNVRGTNRSISYAFHNRYKKLSLQEEKRTRELIGDAAFDALFEKVTELKVRPDMIESLKERLGEDLADFFEVSKSFQAVKDFRQKKFALVEETGDNAVLNKLERRLATKPQMTVE